MPYNFVAHSIHRKQICSRLLQVKCNFRGKRQFCGFEPSFCGL